MFGHTLNPHGVLCVVKLKVIDVLNVQQTGKLLNLLINLWLLVFDEFSSKDQIHNMSISTFMRLFTSMKTVKDMFLVLTPEIAILMPISSFLLRIFQSSIKLNITNSGNLFVFFVLIVKAKEFRQFDDLIPDSFGKLNDLFFIKIDIFDTDTTVVVKSVHNFFFICDEIIDFG
jgi:hypothetical protein